MNPTFIITVAAIIAAFLIFAKFIYPKIIEKKHISFKDKAEAFLKMSDISYDNSDLIYAEQNRNKGDKAAKVGKQLALGIVGIQDYSDFVKYVIIYNSRHIVFVPICVSELSGNIILCEENDEVVRDIKISEISEIRINENTGLCKFVFNGHTKIIAIPDKTAPYSEQTELKNNFINFLKSSIKNICQCQD